MYNPSFKCRVLASSAFARCGTIKQQAQRAVLAVGFAVLIVANIAAGLFL
jgi:hypothetical protein